MKAKKWSAFVLAILTLAASVSGCAAGSSTSSSASLTPASDSAAPQNSGDQPKTVLKFAYDDTEAQSYYAGLLDFKEQLETSTNGSIRVDIYPNGQLGNARDTIEGLNLGTVDCAFASTAAVSAFVPEFAIVDAPFIFKNSQQADAIVDGEIGQMLKDLALQKQNIRVMGFMDTGFRHIFSKKPLTSLKDFSGLKIRTMDSEIQVQTFEALGAIPSPMPSSEVFTALQQNTIDAAENSFSYIVNQKMYEATKYVIKTGHFYAFATILISENVFSKLTPDEQQKVLDAADHCIQVQRELVTKQNEENEKKLKDELGIEVLDIDRDELYQAVQPLYEKQKELLKPEWVELINGTK